MSFSLPAASSNAPEVDALLAALLLMSCAVLALVFGLMFFYVVRYRAGSRIDRGALAERTFRFEISWTAATLAIFFGLFLWGADLYVRLFEPPADALKVYVVGKQWMWKVEHPGGQREIDTLHVPADQPIELVMTSEDVIHDFSVPAFRLKRDVVPGRYETLWFRADRPGTYHLYCDQFCGTDHAHMVGEVVVLSGPDYRKWLSVTPGSETLAAQGQALFIHFGCSGCHGGNGAGSYGGPGGSPPGSTGQAPAPSYSTVRAPPLVGLYGSPVPLSDGSVVIADDRYIRDSILDPGAQIVASYQNVMPSFAGQISEEDLVKLIAYIKSLGAQRADAGQTGG
ncbi:MAG: cytochrome c oxidase subunit II [Acidisphaera sp.]|nr:cytochrome c oxidase subunit II [Acidisphaera sp.]